MAIEKMSLINLVGNMQALDQTLLRCLRCGYFHSEASAHKLDTAGGLKLLDEHNPYPELFGKVTKLMAALKIEPKDAPPREELVQPDEVRSDLEQVTASIESLTAKEHSLQEQIAQHEQTLIQIRHLAGLNVKFDDLFSMKYIKVRLGRLPMDSYHKLSYYENKTFFFFPFEKDDAYCWGAYVAPVSKIPVIDDIFSSLYFERLRVPSDTHDKPEVAIAALTAKLAENRDELAQVSREAEEYGAAQKETLLSYYNDLRFARTVFEMRKNVASVNGKFYVTGFIPKSESEQFTKLFDDMPNVSCTIRPQDADPSLQPPIKLKNNRFTRPFEMFTTMYSLPSSKDMDPTPLVALTYTLLFGIMFGDLGQGLLLSLIGALLSRFKKMALGPIMVRIGFSSAFFGLIYGSVFGYEHLLDPLYQQLFHLPSKPIEVFDSNTTSILLVSAIALGAVLISVSMLVNIVMGLKSRDLERGLFGQNGVAGLVFYLAAAFALCDMLLFGTGIVGLPYLLCLIVLPILCIFFKEPLTKLCMGRKDFMPKQFGSFCIESFFEMFEYVLSYLSNSMSFLRVGGFILSHAGMMTVVMSLSEMVGKTASPIVVIIGNLFVMCLEGLIAGIQALRLEFYEIFSRNFEGNGKPYHPVTVNEKL